MIKRKLIAIFSVVFAACYACIFLLAAVWPFAFHRGKDALLQVAVLLLLTVIVVLFFLSVFRILSRWTDRALNRMTVILFLIMAVAEVGMIIAFNTILPPVIDGGHTYAEALYLLNYGHASGNDYFGIYPNNIPVTLLRYGLYRLADFIHISNYLLVDRLFCAIILDVGIYVSWKLVRRFFDARTGCLYLLMAGTCFPLFFYIFYFYTDTVAIAFPALLLYLWYMYGRSQKIRYIVLLGLTLAVGVQMRQNLILFLPALVIYMFFSVRWRKTLLHLTLIAAVMFSVGFASQGIERGMGYKTDPALAMPSIHWMMLGLSPDGGYSKADYRLTRQGADQSAKKSIDRREIYQRMHRNGISGLMRIWTVKTARTWAAGAHGYDWYMRLSTHPTRSYQYLFNRQNQLTVFVIQIFYLANLFLIVMSSFRYFHTRKVDLNLLIQICLFGNFLFYTFVWEAEPRYSLLFTPFMLIGAVFGLHELTCLTERREAVRLRYGADMDRARLVLFSSLMLLVIAGALSGARVFTETKIPQRAYVVDQSCAAGGRGAQVDAHHNISQTFRDAAPYDHIAFHVLGSRGYGIYEMTVADRRTGKQIASRMFSNRLLEPRQELIFSTNQQPPGPRKESVVHIRQLGGSSDAKVVFALNGRGYEQRDIYPGGHYMQNGRVFERQDLQFSAYLLQYRPYLSRLTYWLLILLPILMLVTYACASMNPIARLKMRSVPEKLQKEMQKG